MPDSAAAARNFHPAAAILGPSAPAAKISNLASPEAQYRQDEQRYSLIVRGLSKKETCPDSLQRLADSILVERFRFFPPRDQFVDRVFYCLHIDGDMAILVFYTELESELLFHLCRDENTSPFAIAGKRYKLERFYTASDEFTTQDGDGMEAATFVYLSGIPGNWEDSGRIEDYFNELLERDFPAKVVTSVRLRRGSAYVEFRSPEVVRRLVDRCAMDRSVVAGIGRGVVLCCGEKVLPLSQEPIETLDSLGKVEIKETEDLQEIPIERQSDEESARTNNSGQGERLTVLREKMLHEKQHSVPKALKGKDPSNCHQELPLPKYAKQRPADRSVMPRNLNHQQTSVMLGGFKGLQILEAQRLTKLFLSLFQKHKHYTTEADLKVHVVWDNNANGVRVILASEDMTDRLMEMYVRSPDEFTLDRFKFWMSRPQGYRRPRAVYRTGAFSSDLKVLLFTGCRPGRSAHRQLKGALKEALDTVLCDAGVLEEGKPLLKNLFFREEGLYGVLEEEVATALTRTRSRLFVAGTVLNISEPPSQRTIAVVNLPTDVSSYDPVKLRQVLRSGMKKLKPDESVADCIAKISWPVSQGKAKVELQSDAAADALMTAYIRYNQDFCIPTLPLTLHRFKNYVWPAALYRPKNISSATSVLNLTGFPLSLDSKPLLGAVCELVVRTVLKDGVLEECEKAVKHFFWKNGTRVAKVTVDEVVAEKLVAATGLVIAESPVAFYREYPVHEPAVARTGGWIDEEEGEETMS